QLQLARRGGDEERVLAGDAQRLRIGRRQGHVAVFVELAQRRVQRRFARRDPPARHDVLRRVARDSRELVARVRREEHVALRQQDLLVAERVASNHQVCVPHGPDRFYERARRTDRLKWRMAYNRDAAVTYARLFSQVPCSDGFIMLNGRGGLPDYIATPDGTTIVSDFDADGNIVSERVLAADGSPFT